MDARRVENPDYQREILWNWQDAVVGWRAQCTACPWYLGKVLERSIRTSPGAVPPSSAMESLQAEWNAHVLHRVPELKLHEASLAVNKAVSALHARVSEARINGISWARIGDAVGVSRQAAHERWGNRRTRTR
jgi:hypothetical protein